MDGGGYGDRQEDRQTDGHTEAGVDEVGAKQERS